MGRGPPRRMRDLGSAPSSCRREAWRRCRMCDVLHGDEATELARTAGVGRRCSSRSLRSADLASRTPSVDVRRGRLWKLSRGLTGTGLKTDKTRVAVEQTWNKERQEGLICAHSCICGLTIRPSQWHIGPSQNTVFCKFKSCQPESRGSSQGGFGEIRSRLCWCPRDPYSNAYSNAVSSTATRPHPTHPPMHAIWARQEHAHAELAGP